MAGQAPTQSATVEEAAVIAADFIQSLDSLPVEIRFLLDEIGEKDVQSRKLQAAIDERIRHANPRLYRQNANMTSNADLNARIQPSLDRLDALAREKVALAQRLVSLMDKTCARLDYNIDRVRVASGGVSTRPSVLPLLDLSGARNTAETKVKVVPVQDVPTPVTATPIGPPPLKRRKNDSHVSTPVTVATPPPPPPEPAPRLRTTVKAPSPPPKRHPTARTVSSRKQSPKKDDSEDAAGEDDEELYCSCRRPSSFGDMIGCDNPDCHFKWFHMSCVGYVGTGNTDESWFCPDCRGASPKFPSQVGGGGAAGRKARKK